jgi:hypothetical protein
MPNFHVQSTSCAVSPLSCRFAAKAYTRKAHDTRFSKRTQHSFAGLTGMRGVKVPDNFWANVFANAIGSDRMLAI